MIFNLIDFGLFSLKESKYSLQIPSTKLFQLNTTFKTGPP